MGVSVCRDCVRGVFGVWFCFFVRNFSPNSNDGGRVVVAFFAFGGYGSRLVNGAGGVMTECSCFVCVS